MPNGAVYCFRLYAKECLLLNIRFWVFAIAQSAFIIIANDSEKEGIGEWGLMENIALSGCACLIVAILSVAFNICRNSPFVLPRSTMNHYLIYLRNSHCNTTVSSPDITNNHTTGRHSETDFLDDDNKGIKWVLCGLSIACGIFLFVMGYSIHGTTWLPQISMATVSVICIFFDGISCHYYCNRGTKNKHSINYDAAHNNTDYDTDANDTNDNTVPHDHILCGNNNSSNNNKHNQSGPPKTDSGNITAMTSIEESNHETFSIDSDENSTQSFFFNREEMRSTNSRINDNNGITSKIMKGHPKKKTIATAICMLFAVFLLGGNGFFLRPQEWTPHNMWLGLIMPSASAVVLCKCSELATNYGIQADRVVAFGMPSVGLTALTFLSLYSPPSLYSVLSTPNNIDPQSKQEFLNAFSSSSAAWQMFLPYQNNNYNASAETMYWYRMFVRDTLTPSDMNNVLIDTFGLNKASKNGSLLDTYYNLFFDNNNEAYKAMHYDHVDDATKLKNMSNSSGKMDQNIVEIYNHNQKQWTWHAAEKAWDYVSNQTYQYQLYIIPATLFGTIRPRTSLAILASVAAPILLWSSMTIFLAGFFCGRRKSVVAVWLLSVIACQLWWHGITVPLILALIIVKMALIFDILPNELSTQPKSPEEVVLSSVLSSDDEEEK
jgi:hypothetical protein